MRRSWLSALFAASLLAAVGQAGDVAAQDAGAPGPKKISTVAQIFDRLKTCFKPPRLPRDHPGMEITFLVSFTKTGDIFGKPRITYESDYASDDDRLLYRTALAEALQRCAPMPFTEMLGDAVAGRPLRMRIDNRRTKST